MQDYITNAHRLIGETIREPGDERRGRIVGVDQSRAVPAIFVIWHRQSGIQRVELSWDALRQLAEACARIRATGTDSADRGDTGATAMETRAPVSARRRVGFR